MRKMGRQQRESVQFGSATIPFTLEYRPRKHIGITVRPDLCVFVAAPEGTPVETVRERVRRRAPWILRQLDRFETYRPRPTPRQYLTGETHRYLGRQYRLKVRKATDDTVRLLGRYLTVETSAPKDSRRVRRLVDEWYRSHAFATFDRRLAICLTKHPRVVAERPALLIRKMKTRWGSCTKAGRILLNTELVQAPVECIDYVIVHELCHLKVPDHSPAFYKLLTNSMPDWQRRKAKLEGLRI